MDSFFPEILITYLCHFRQAFSSTSFPYFQGFIAALLLSSGRKCVTRIASVCFFLDKSLTSWERFLSQAQWNMPLVTQQLISLCISELGDALLYANRYVVALDTTFVQKVLGQMPGVQRWSQNTKKRATNVSIIGHHWGICGLLSFMAGKWRCFPILPRLISGQIRPSHFIVGTDGVAAKMDFWDTVIAMIVQVSACITSAPLCVVADAYFAKAIFLNALIDRGIGLVTRLRWDAVGWDDPIYCGRGRRPKRGRKWKLAKLLDHFPRQQLTVELYGKTVTVVAVVRDLWLRDVKRKVRLVVIEAQKRPILLVSTALGLTPKQIIEIYGGRFALELAIRELKQNIGFCDYQSTQTIAFLRFTQLCCCALSIGRLILYNKQSLDGLAADSPDTVSEETMSFRKLRRCLRRYVLSRLISFKSTPGAESEKRDGELEEARNDDLISPTCHSESEWYKTLRKTSE